MRRLKDKVATRDGRDRGDCNAIAQYLAVEGASVVVNDASHKEDGDREVTEITNRMVARIAIQANVSRKPMSSSCFAEAENGFGRVDILVRNAGVCEFRPLESSQRRALWRHLDTHVLGLILASQPAAKHFDSSGGSIINIGF
jgi:3-oxoacyl-[acyl-carrier protein] reductase